MCVCSLSVLTGIDFCNWWTYFETNLITGHCYSLVVISWKWEKSDPPFIVLGGVKNSLIIILFTEDLPSVLSRSFWMVLFSSGPGSLTECPVPFWRICVMQRRHQQIKMQSAIRNIRNINLPIAFLFTDALKLLVVYTQTIADWSCHQPCVPAGLWQTGRLQVCLFQTFFPTPRTIL